MPHYTLGMLKLGAIALALPGAVEGVACAGTTLESRAYSVNRRNFLFVSEKLARLKLEAYCAEAQRLGCEVGANGWVKLSFDTPPPTSVVRRWIAESHLLAGGGGSRTKKGARAAAPKRPKS